MAATKLSLGCRGPPVSMCRTGTIETTPLPARIRIPGVGPGQAPWQKGRGQARQPPHKTTSIFRKELHLLFFCFEVLLWRPLLTRPGARDLKNSPSSDKSGFSLLIHCVDHLVSPLNPISTAFSRAVSSAPTPRPPPSVSPNSPLLRQ